MKRSDDVSSENLMKITSKPTVNEIFSDSNRYIMCTPIKNEYTYLLNFHWTYKGNK